MRISDWSSDVCSSDLLEALHVDHRLADDVPDEGYVDTGLVLRQLALELRQAQTEVLAQHLEQGHVEDRLVVVCHDPDARGRALAFDLDRHQDEWRTVAARFMLHLLPLQHAVRQEARCGRSEVGRVGKVGGSTCRSWW